MYTEFHRIEAIVGEKIQKEKGIREGETERQERQKELQ